MVNIFFRFWRVGSFLLAVAALLYCYTAMPENIAVTHKDTGEPIRFMDKQNFFYIASGVLLFFNLLMKLLKEQLQKVEFSNVNPNSIWAKNKTALSELIAGWFDAFLAFTNTYLVFVFLGLNNINSTDTQRLDFNYNWILLIGAVILMVLLFSLPLRLLFSNPVEND